MAHHLVDFLDQGAVQAEARWTRDSVDSMGRQEAPSEFLGLADWLLKGDLKILWARWMAEGICDPRQYPDTGSYPRFLKDLQSALDALSARRPADEVAAMAGDLAKVLWKGVESSRRSVARRAWRKEEREQAWDLAQPDPRCWICGYQFQPGARQQYLRETVTDPVPMPAFVDAYAPRGLRAQDLRIEVDHVVALAGGGRYEDNLRLACGWCNRYKSSKQVLYDAIMELKEVVLADGQIRAVPPQFWVVRLLALRGRCESPAGCTATTSNAQLTVAPIVRTGAPTPTNLWVTCKEHDPLRDNRLVESAVLDRLKTSGGSQTDTAQAGG